MDGGSFKGVAVKKLQKKFDTREQLVSYVKALSPWGEGECSNIEGGHQKASTVLSNLDPVGYGMTRNYGTGKVSRLSPFIHHGVLSLNEVRNHALTKCENADDISKFIQELAWRDFWQNVLARHPDWAWNDIEPLKTGFDSNDYADHLPHDIASGATGVACLDAFIKELNETGYIHNHARMYLASYVVHFRRIKWQVGAKWFLKHLLDGDLASNNLSWQWVASTFSNKPYIFNLENVTKYFGNLVDTTPSANKAIDASYEELTTRLFPALRRSS